MKTYYWSCENKDKSLVEGKFSLVERVFGRVFMGRKFNIIGDWHNDL